MTIYLIVGLPGAGKTTRAKELEISESALRLTPDDWQMAIFGGDDPTRWRSKDRADQRDRIEGKLVEIGMRAAQLGIDVVFDFGLWGKDERSALRWIADTLGVRAQVVYLPIDYEEQRRRITDRYEIGAGSVPDERRRAEAVAGAVPGAGPGGAPRRPRSPRSPRACDLVAVGVRALAVVARSVLTEDPLGLLLSLSPSTVILTMLLLRHGPSDSGSACSHCSGSAGRRLCGVNRR